jgi:uncharacterized protein (TIGR04255 family)
MNPSKWASLQNPPIVEALLDIRAELPKTAQLEQLSRLEEPFKKLYPTKRAHLSWRGDMHVASETIEVVKSGGQDGLVFQSLDGRRIVQARLNGFTFNKLKPYDSWTIFRDEARSAWNIYVSTSNPTRITRLGLRFINAIQLPFGSEFKDYFRTFVEIAPELPQSLESFIVRLIIPFERFNCKAIVTETTRPLIDKQTGRPDPEKFDFVLDIDVFRIGTFSKDSDDMWAAFDLMREAKNELFFASITDRARELFA